MMNLTVRPPRLEGSVGHTRSRPAPPGAVAGAARAGNDRTFGIRVADTPRLRERALQLVHEAHAARSLGDRDLARYKRSCRRYLHGGKAVTFLAEASGDYIGTITIIVDSTVGLPADRIFPEEVDKLREAGRRSCEAVALALGHNARTRDRTVVFQLFRMAVAAAGLAECTDMVATVMARHGTFYRRVLLFDRVSSETRVSPKTGAQVRFARLDLLQAPARFERFYGAMPHHRNLSRFLFDPIERERLKGWLGRRRLSTVLQNKRRLRRVNPDADCPDRA
jgi:hypothetical protein